MLTSQTEIGSGLYSEHFCTLFDGKIGNYISYGESSKYDKPSMYFFTGLHFIYEEVLTLASTKVQ